MDQSSHLRTSDRAAAIEALTDHIVGALEQARVDESPFYHLEFERVFPDHVYSAMLAAMPEANDYRPMSGRSRGNDLADGTHTRVKLDLFSEFIRRLPPEKRGVWDVVGAALCSEPVKQAFVRMLAPPLERRFGAGFLRVVATFIHFCVLAGCVMLGWGAWQQVVVGMDSNSVVLGYPVALLPLPALLCALFIGVIALKDLLTARATVRGHEGEVE
jgi:hypothetical protein